MLRAGGGRLSTAVQTRVVAPSLSDRLFCLGQLEAAFEARRDELVRAVGEIFHRPTRLAEGEVSLALARLGAFGAVAPLVEGREPVGTLALVLPGNAALSNPSATIGNAFLGGNRVVARFPSSSRSWASRVEPLFEAHLPGVSFDHRPGREFLEWAITEPEVAVVMVFGDDSWARAYEPLVREHRKKLIFEGPGNDPFVVLPGADLEHAARDAVRGAFYDAGQACTSPERFYVYRELADAFLERVVELTRAEVVGDAVREEVTVGPIVNRWVVERIAAQLADARDRGAEVLVGGGIEEVVLADGTPAHLVEPTVLRDVDPASTLLAEETFGPVIPVVEVEDAAEALELAGAGRYGLTASLYGGGDAEWRELARGHGHVFRDEIWIDFFRRHLHAPYGGRKDSGWVWAWEGGRFVRREGSRVNALEFTRCTSREPTDQEIAGRLCATIPSFRSH